MGLPWIRLDTSTFDHPKMLELMEAKQYRAIVVHLSGMAYSGKHGLDGFIPKAALRVIGGTAADVRHLIGVGLWDLAENGWDVHGWRDYQFSSEEHEARRQRLSERGRKAAEAKWKNQRKRDE
ncbi:putative bacteriophage protein [Nocardia nova SH22a]|uniref:Putative bacteriophage protein n=1 Tax=Nocardia nova SH22a TaxID=1415166 RepID=W5TN36_9NOCA|nr:hypothetical protein [Nocardia nova]AHH20770.1 putative bacteriophage protein [Nocardia nova SH22a]